MKFCFALLVLILGPINAMVNMDPYKQQILDLHNNLRREEQAANMQKMKWNTQLEREAAMWADDCVFEHQQQGRGENLAMHTGRWPYENLIETGIKMWADEKRDYIYGSTGFTAATGHYTQMVWADTTDVGCGMTRCPSLTMGRGTPVQNAWYFVCFYSPPGNFIGQLPYVRGEACSQCSRGQYCDRGLCSDSKGSGKNTQPDGPIRQEPPKTPTINTLPEITNGNTGNANKETVIEGFPSNGGTIMRTTRTPNGWFTVWETRNNFGAPGGRNLGAQMGSSFWERTGNCRDQFWCERWSDLCSDPRYARSLTRSCPVICGQCSPSGGSRTAGSGGVQIGACMDAMQNCVFWGQMGMCANPFFPNQIKQQCARTCNMC